MSCVRPAVPVLPGPGRPGRTGAVMAGMAVRESVSLAGRVERARAARMFVGEVLGPGHPCGDLAILLVSEVFGNSIRQNGSGALGETVTVAVGEGDGVVRGEVTDRAGQGTPQLRLADLLCGRRSRASACRCPRGAVRWDWRRRGGRLVTWFELS